MTHSPGIGARISGLGWFFLRAAPVRAAGVVSGIVALLLMATLIVLQSLSLSGEQEADRAVGSAAFALPTGTSVALGASGSEMDEALRNAIIAAGGTAARVQYSVLDDLELEGDGRSADVNLEEASWADNPFPSALRVREGEWPIELSETAVSAALSDRFPIGSTLELFGGQWRATVVGVVEQDFIRDLSTIYLAEGTWNSLAGVPDADRYGDVASRTLYWSGGATDQILSDVAQLLTTEQGAVPVDLLMGQLQSRDELVAKGSASLIEFRLASLLAPFLAAMTGVLLATRFSNRIRSVMLSVGIARNRTRTSALVAVAVSLAIGLVIGSGLGIGIGFMLRPAIDSMSQHVLGPVHDIGIMFAGIVVSTLIGAGLAIGVNAVRQRRGLREQVARGRAPSHFVVLPVLSLVLLTAGYLLAQAALSVDQIVLAGILLAAAGVVLLPLALDLILTRDPARLPALLAIRRLREDNRQAGWITTTVAALLIVGFATSTLLASAIGTMNATNYASVPPGQIHLTLPDGAPVGLEQEIIDYLGIEPLPFYSPDGGVTLLDGGTVVVEDEADFEALTGVTLTTEERALLDAGGTIRSKGADITEVTFERNSGGSFTMPALTNDALSPDFRSLDGFILRKTAEANDVTLGVETLAFLNATPEQLTRAENASIELGFSADWLAVSKTPDVFDEPLEARIAAAVISALAIAVLIFFVMSVTRLLRPKLSALRSVGVGRRWLVEVLALETSVVLAAAAVGAAATAVAGMFAAIVVSRLDIKLIVPWQSVGATVAVLVVGAVIATCVASRRLTNDDRFAST